MKKELRWRAYYGYNPTDYVKVKNEDLERTKYAMITGNAISIDGKMIKGSEIKRIEQDIRYYTGWYDTYKPTNGDDEMQIKRDVPLQLLEKREEEATMRVSEAVQSGNTAILKEPSKLLLN